MHPHSMADLRAMPIACSLAGAVLLACSPSHNITKGRLTAAFAVSAPTPYLFEEKWHGVHIRKHKFKAWHGRTVYDMVHLQIHSLQRTLRRASKSGRAQARPASSSGM